MPLYGLTGKTADRLRFSWINVRMLHSLIILSANFVMMSLSLNWVTQIENVTISDLGTKLHPNAKHTIFNILPSFFISIRVGLVLHVDRIVWFATKMFIMMYFILLARQWPGLMIEWERIEQNLPKFIGRKRNFAFFNQIKFYTILTTVSLFSK